MKFGHSLIVITLVMISLQLTHIVKQLGAIDQDLSAIYQKLDKK